MTRKLSMAGHIWRAELNKAAAKRAAVAPDMQTALVEAEAALGENLQWLTDALGVQVRQGDAETLQRLAQLNAAWVTICRALPAK